MDSAPISEIGRPIPVRAFEALAVVSALAALLWPYGDGPFASLMDFLISVALALWVTRGRSNVGRLLYTGLIVFAAIALTVGIRSNYMPAGVPPAPVVMFAIQSVVLLGLLWWPTTSRWLNQPSTVRAS